MDYITAWTQLLVHRLCHVFKFLRNKVLVNFINYKMNSLRVLIIYGIHPRGIYSKYLLSDLFDI